LIYPTPVKLRFTSPPLSKGRGGASFPASGWECLLAQALPALLAAEPLKLHFQVEPGNEILERFWLKLTLMSKAKCPYSQPVLYPIENYSKV